MKALRLLPLWLALTGFAADTNMPPLAEIRTAAEKGDALSQYKLGYAYESQYEYISAARWYEPAAKQGLADAQYRLARLLMNERKVEVSGRLTSLKKDAPQAVSWFQKAADQNHPLAQFALGRCYADGDGVGRDYAEAYKWYSLAAKLGNTDAAEARDKLILKMTSHQVEQGQKKADEFKPTAPTPPAPPAKP